MNAHLMRTAFVVSVVLGIPSAVTAAELTQEIRTRDGFTMYLPEDWVRIPDNVMEERFNAAWALMEIPDTPPVVHAFGLRNAADPVAFPLIVIHISRDGRWPDIEVAKLDQLRKHIAEEFKKGKAEWRRLSLDLQLGETLYDPEHQTIWTLVSLQSEGGARFRALLGTRLTREGFIQLVCTAEEDEFEKYNRLFVDIVLNIKIDPGLAYKPRHVQSGAEKYGRIMVYVIVTVVVLIWAVRRRRKQNSAEHDLPLAPRT